MPCVSIGGHQGCERGARWDEDVGVPRVQSEMVVDGRRLDGIDAVKFAYLDPPYLGCCDQYDHFHGETDGCWDNPETHIDLIERVQSDYPDGWALSCSAPSLQTLLPACAHDVRIGAWVKSFSAFKKGVRPAYAWEPVLFRGGRNPTNGHRHPPPPKGGKQTTPKDFFITEDDHWEVIICPITMRKGLTGAKPPAFCRWVFDLLNAQPGDELDDPFLGTGIVTKTWRQYMAEKRVRARHAT
jgi:hypothetical protein